MANGKQIDFLKHQQAAQKRVENLQNTVDETQYLIDNAVKNKMAKTIERLTGQLKRQQIALAHAKAELAEWSNVKP